jgi:flagella basal body P-ring formation protein FlgA
MVVEIVQGGIEVVFWVGSSSTFLIGLVFGARRGGRMGCGVQRQDLAMCSPWLMIFSVFLSLGLGASALGEDSFSKLLEPVKPLVGGSVEQRKDADVGRNRVVPKESAGASDVAQRARELLGLVKPDGKTAPTGEKAKPASPSPSMEGRADGPMVLTTDLLEIAIAKDLGVRMGVREGEVRVKVIKEWMPLNIPSSAHFVEAFNLQGGGLTSMMAFYIRVISGGLVMGEWPIQARVELFQDVWVAQQRMERGQVVEDDAVESKRIDVLKERAVPLPNSFKLTGYELSMPVAAGKVLTRRDIIEKELVKKGQMVDVLVSQGSLSLRMKAMALEGGAAGITVKLRNLDSRKEFFGEVVAEGQVSVKLF